MTLKNFNKKYSSTIASKILLPLIFGILGGLIGIALFMKFQEKPDMRIKSFYSHEMATVVSPAALKKMVDEKDTSYVLVDLRSAGEYNNEHFITAVNVPAGSMDEDQLVAAFEALPKDKQIIVHCYSAYCTLGRQVGESLANRGIYVKELTVGWSELRYHWDLWNPGAKVTDGESYIVKGSKTDTSIPAPCVSGQFGC